MNWQKVTPSPPKPNFELIRDFIVAGYPSADKG